MQHKLAETQVALREETIARISVAKYLRKQSMNVFKRDMLKIIFLLL